MSRPADEPTDEPTDDPVDPAVYAEHALFDQCEVCFDHPPPTQTARQVVTALLLSAVLFVGAAYLQSPDLVLILLLVVFIHELGHYAGMKVFGYRNVKLVFVPFFGGAVVGEKVTAPAWQQLVVLLLGPLPGLFLAVLLFLTCRPSPDTWLDGFVLALVGINALNLLPLVPLDGGRVVELLLFARSPVLTVGFRVVAVLGLTALAWAVSSVLLFGLAVFIALGTPAAYRFGVAARQFRTELGAETLPPTPDALGQDRRWTLYRLARKVVPVGTNPWTLAAVMKRLYAEGVAGFHAGWAVTVAGFIAYLGGFALTALFTWLVWTFAPEADVQAGREALRPRLEQIEQLERHGRVAEVAAELPELGRTWMTLRPPVRRTLLTEYDRDSESWSWCRSQAHCYLDCYDYYRRPPRVIVQDHLLWVDPDNPSEE